MLVKLSDTVSVNPDYVASVVTYHEMNYVLVTMHDDRQHSFGPDYGRSIWETADRIMKLINGDKNG